MSLTEAGEGLGVLLCAASHILAAHERTPEPSPACSDCRHPQACHPQACHLRRQEEGLWHTSELLGTFQ